MTIAKETLDFMLERMLRIRRFEEKLKDVHKLNIPGMVHLYIGEEAVAVGVCATLTVQDRITSTHRGHGHVIAKGADLKLMMAELYARRDGYCRGKGGSMHVADVGLGILGANGIVGGGLTLATGAGLASKLQGTGTVSVCFFGDGAANQGALQECLNLSSVWKLPVIYVCENNLYHEFSPSAPVTAGQIADRAKPFGVPGVVTDGMDVLAVYADAQEAVERARRGGGPTLIEARTYRFEAHDQGEFALIGTTYRGQDEVSSWQARDPLAQFARWLVERGHRTEPEIAALDQQIQREVEAAVAFAEASPFPAPEEAFDHVFVD
jgi:acetoin:2,6-dichlorophenolindophenol oxidoreductase subunit alpha